MTSRSHRTLSAISLVSLLFVFAVPALHPATGQQKQSTQQRERRVETAPVSTTPPKPERQSVQGTSADTGQSTAPALTLDELRARIRQVIERPELAPALVGVKIVSLDTNKLVYEHNADKLLRPASNMKLYTVAAALDRLGPDFRFVTSVYADARPDQSGRIHGDLTIYGRGDPTFAARFYDGDYYKGIDALAAKIASAGIKRIDGDLVGDESYFDGAPYGDGWTWDDLTWYYGAEISALTVVDNSLDLTIKPGVKPGQPGSITVGPITTVATIANRTVTAAAGSKTDITIYRPLNENVIEVSGSVALGSGSYSRSVAISHPANLFISMLRNALAQRGITVAGKLRLKSSRDRVSTQTAKQPLELTRLESPPFSLVAAQTLKPSQNLYTELILRALGRSPAGTATIIAAQPQTADELGHNVVRAFLREAGVDSDGLVLNDGSGLSRTDLVTPAATVQLLTYMSRHRYAEQFREAQPLAGVDGTLRNRFKGTPAENNLRAKTGTLSGVTSLSGYVTTAAGEHLVFSMMLNNFAEDTVSNRTTLDVIGILLAGFKGRT